jgi:hypothetical protein
MNPVEAVAIIIAVFFIAGLVVGFLIVMAPPAIVAHQGSRRVEGPRGDNRRGGGPRTYNDTEGTDGLGGSDGPPGSPWWHDNWR